MKTALSFQKVLWAFFAFIGLMILVRYIFSGKHAFVFLIWNLFLAWIPLVLSASLIKMQQHPKWKQAAVFVCWLLFFPNALYIVTDLIHLEMETSIPKWFDAILIFSASVAGLLMAFVSLMRIEVFLSKKFTKNTVHALTVAILFLGSFGVYLGRFLRWNSWDVLGNPLNLFRSVASRLIFPFDHLYTWGVTLLLTTLFYLVYMIIKKLPGYLNQATL